MLDQTSLHALITDASQHIFDEGCPPVSLPGCDHYAGNARFAEKAISMQHRLGPVLDITLDLEDGAKVGHEARQVEWAAEVINSIDNHFQRIGVRIHDLDSPFWKQDIQTLIEQAGDKIAYLTIPKIRSAAQITEVEQFVKSLQQAVGLTDDSAHRIPLHALIETHSALHEIDRIAAHPAVECLSFGLMDFVSAHYGAIPSSAMRSPGQFDHPLVSRAKLNIAAASIAHGKVASHNVTTDVNDPATVLHDAQQARYRFGFTRMWSIHPMQIEPILFVMSPSAAEVEEAILILKAAQQQHWGPIRHGDILHDRASYRYYLQMLKNTAQ